MRQFIRWMVLLLISIICLGGGSVMAEPASEPQSSAKSVPGETARNVQTRKLSDTELDALLGYLEKELGAIQSMKTEFVQERRLSIFTDPIEAKGILLFVRPDKVRFEITEPFHSVLITGTDSVAKFEFIGGEWKKLNLGAPDAILMVTRQIATWLQGRFRDEQTVYEVSAAQGEHTIIILTPKPEQLKRFIAAIELQLTPEKNRIASVTIREPAGDYTRMKFFHQERDVEVPERFFVTTGSIPAQLHLLYQP